MSSVKLDNIFKRFRRKEVLESVTLEAGENSITVVLGPPGAGKTTMLRIVAGLEKPDRERIYLVIEILQSYLHRNVFVGYLTGNPGMSFIDCELVDSTLKCYDIVYRLDGKEAEVLSKYGNEFKIGIRPEHIEIDRERGLVKALCTIRENLGAMSILYLKTSGGVMLRAKVPESVAVREGMRSI